MDDFAFFIPEKDFMDDPIKALERVKMVPEEVIQRKVHFLRLAQRIFMPDHSESLFVPALLREATESNKKSYIERALKRAQLLLARNGIFPV